MNRRLLGLAVAALLAAACGGSGGGPTAPGGLTVEAVEAESFALVNNARQSEGVEPELNLDARIARVAREHSEAMRDQGFFGHAGPSGQNLARRLAAAGISYRTAGENLAQVSHPIDPAGAAHLNLMRSAAHRGNILDARFRRAAVGVARDGDRYWLTQIFIQP